MDSRGILQVRSRGTIKNYYLQAPSITIGRLDDNPIVLHDSQVSRQHARIDWVRKSPASMPESTGPKDRRASQTWAVPTEAC
ncbi:MAG: Inner rane component of cytoplasmic domain [Chloroflexi bacterium]|nr:Inner rane component of cytoplasmic domain [Chloroflexota bacterium]